MWLGRGLVVVLAMALVGGTVWWAGEAAGEQAAREAAARLVSRSEGNSDMLRRKLQEMRHDALFLSKVPPVEGLVRARRGGGVDAQEQTPEALWESRLVRIFSAFAADRPDIVQVRLIGVADQGRELVRIDQRNHGMVRTGAAQLQHKGDTDYMRAVVTLAQGQTYLSDFYLNREHGLVETPHWGTVHAATPVYDGAGAVFGAIVINYRADSLLAPLASNLPTDLRAYLVNGAGAFLLHPDPSRTYGFDTGRTWRWQDEFRAQPQPGDDARLRLVANAAGQRFLLVAANIVLDPARPASDLHYWLGVPAAEVVSAVARMRTTIVGAMLAGAVLVVLASHAYRVQRRKMRAYQKQMSAIVEHSRDAIIGLTVDGAITAWNSGAQAMFGYTGKDALGRGFTELIVPPHLVGEATASLRRVAAGDDIIEMATRRQTRGGKELDVMITSSPIRDHLGKVTGIAKIVRDVSEHAAANRRIQELNVSLEAQVEERTRQIASVMVLQHAILAHASHAIIATNREGVIQLFNPAAERMLGYRAADLVGIATPAILHDGAEVVARA
ncbi:MAG: PAS domain S-box protein, partial [Burkholderiaceae bacterium]|nr:PAS domain S-box protein [Burkholderiaceae bacterium]